MITFSKSYKTSDNQVFGSIEEAQLHEIETIIIKFPLFENNSATVPEIAKLIINNKDVIIDILTTTPNSKPKARAIHGGTKKRKTVITDAAVSVDSMINVTQ